MRIAHTTLISAALLAAAALIATPAAAGKVQKQPQADLAVQRISIGRQFAVVKPNGKTTAPITVTVSIRNIGRATAPASETTIRLRQTGRALAEEHIPLARLAPGRASTQIAVFRDAEPQLGLHRRDGVRGALTGILRPVRG